jgi:hypothetical protein
LSDKRTRKPNSVLCGHSSRRRVTAGAHQRPTRRFRQLHEYPSGKDLSPRAPFEPPCRIGPMRSRCLAPGSGFPPYLVLLRVGFTLPLALLPARCALTAPFHPYCDCRCPRVSFLRPGKPQSRRYVLCGTCRPRALKPASRTLSGTLPSGVRTFLSRRPAKASPGSDRPVLLPVSILSRKQASKSWL